MPIHVRSFSALVVVVLALGSVTPPANAGDEGPRPATIWPIAASPEDRYAPAGRCYLLRAPGGRFVVRSGDGFAATTRDRSKGEPFRFRATDLGRYLLVDGSGSFLAASEGAVATAAYTVTRSTPGQVLGGLLLEQTDAIADTLARSAINEASGRGAAVVAASGPDELADWSLHGSGRRGFTLSLPATGQNLVRSGEGSLTLEEGTAATVFALDATDGCMVFPEIALNIKGPVARGQTSSGVVRGFLEAHLHMMAFEFLGGRARCGRPWHRFGVAHALVDCPDHEPGGFGAVLEGAISNGSPDGRHNTDGWPTFEGWPKYGSLTHEQVYYRWLQRAWRGGLRLFVNLLVDNNQLCKAYPYKRNSCNEMDGVRLQALRIRQLQRYIDAQSGGPGEGWFRIVRDPFEARRVINQGKLAVVLGIEVSVPLDCGLTLDMPRCPVDEVDSRLQDVYDLGVRQMELVNKFDNAFSGVTGDGGTTGPVVNGGNAGETGSFWRIETCGDHPDDHEHAYDKRQPNVHDDSPLPKEFTGRDSIFGAILALTGRSGAAPAYPQGPHCNLLGLSELGKTMIAEMAERGMIFDPDHMSARARTQALDYIENELEPVNGRPYSGIVSSHSWADDTIYPRIYELGGVVTPHAGGSTGFVGKWQKHKEWKDDRFYFGFGFGSDVNGFSTQGGPRGADAEDPVTYPFTGFGGTTIGRQESGTRTYNINTDGVAHYGLYPDWIEDLRLLAGDAIVRDLTRGPEAYLQMWERAVGVPPDACRSDVPDLRRSRFASLRAGMRLEDVLWAVGQPSSRVGRRFTYCLREGRTAVVWFTPSGDLTEVVYHGSTAPDQPYPVPDPTGGSSGIKGGSSKSE